MTYGNSTISAGTPMRKGLKVVLKGGAFFISLYCPSQVARALSIHYGCSKT